MIIINQKKCDLCGACVGVCPENIISLKNYRLAIDQEACTSCSKCVWVCPVRALELKIEQVAKSVEQI